MKSPSQSRLCLPNRFARVTMDVIQELVGRERMADFLNDSDLSHLIDNYPPASLERGFDFADFAALNTGLEKKYGERGGRSTAARLGGQVFSRIWEELLPLAGRGGGLLSAIPGRLKLRIALPALAQLISRSSDQTCVAKVKRRRYEFLALQNAVCWGRRNEERPACSFLVGFLAEAIYRITADKALRVDEVECMASGAASCRFVIRMGYA